MSAFVLGTLITVACLVLSVLGLVIVRKYVHVEHLQVNHEVGAVMISILGTMYAVLLGLVVVDALGHRKQATTMESSEANALSTMMHLSRCLPRAKRKVILQAELDYLELTTSREWQHLEHGSAPEKETVQAVGALWQAAGNFEPANAKEQNVHASMLSELQQFSEARRYRVSSSKQGLPALLWGVILTGGVCIIAFTYFFGAESLAVQAVMTMVVTLMLCLNILLVFFYGSPYRGDLRLEPDELIRVRSSLRNAPILQNQDDTGQDQSQ